MATSYWGVDHGETVSKGFFETDVRPSQRKKSYNRPGVFNSRKDNTVGAAAGGGTGAALGWAAGSHMSGVRARPRELAAVGALGAGAGALAGAASYSKNSKSKRAVKLRTKIDSNWDKHQAKKNKKVSKADYGKPSGGRRVTAQAFGPFHGAVAGKPGKKIRATANQGIGNVGGYLGGGALGSAAGMLATRGRSPLASAGGGAVGSVGGWLAGGQAGVKRNQRKGYLKPQKVS